MMYEFQSLDRAIQDNMNLSYWFKELLITYKFGEKRGFEKALSIIKPYLSDALLKEFEENPKDIWGSNIFGKSLSELINEGLHNKLYRMPSDARLKLQETIERIINEGCGGLICIIL